MLVQIEYELPVIVQCKLLAINAKHKSYNSDSAMLVMPVLCNVV